LIKSRYSNFVAIKVKPYEHDLIFLLSNKTYHIQRL